jgi:hypothetical protein
MNVLTKKPVSDDSCAVSVTAVKETNKILCLVQSQENLPDRSVAIWQYMH